MMLTRMGHVGTTILIVCVLFTYNYYIPVKLFFISPNNFFSPPFTVGSSSFHIVDKKKKRVHFTFDF